MAETVGWLCDKISIAELKIYHMREQAERPDGEAEFRDRCRQRLAVLQVQRDDLAVELSTLVADILAGKVTPKVYSQFKMYNDPQYKAGGSAAGRGG